MSAYGEEFWEQSWKKDAEKNFLAYSEPFYRLSSREIRIFQENDIHTVCDAGCGFGAYTLAFASNGFAVKSFDVSQTAVEISKQILKHYGIEAADMKAASILETGYDDEAFDGVVAYSVLDHLTVSDAKAALRELLRITKTGGLIMLAFDTMDEDDLTHGRLVLHDGSIQYTDPAKNGMIFHPYDVRSVDEFLKGQNIIHRNTGTKGEIIVILKK